MCTKAGARHGAWHQVEKKRNYFAVPGAPFLVRNRSSQSDASTIGTRSGATVPGVSSTFHQERLSQEDYSQPNHPTTLRFNTEVQNEAILALVGQDHVWCGPTPKPPPSP